MPAVSSPYMQSSETHFSRTGRQKLIPSPSSFEPIQQGTPNSNSVPYLYQIPM